MFSTIKKGLLTAAMLAGLGLAALPAQASDAKDVIYKGDARCTSCHDESEVKPVLSIAKTKHGVAKDGRVPTCVSCHGESDAHVNKPDDVQVRPATDKAYGKKSHLTAEEQSANCTSCHQGGKHMNWNTSAHARNDVSCTSCHQIHTGHDAVRDKREQPEVCYSCHKQQRADANKPSHHPIPEGKMTCSDCHNTHGSAGEKMLIKDTVNATCYTCHAEKRGPFVHNHQPVSDDCSNCHNPHGTVADALLKVRPPFLCIQCHDSNNHHKNPAAVAAAAGFANTTSSTIGIGMARSCMNCHTQVHGTNNPSSATKVMRLMR